MPRCRCISCPEVPIIISAISTSKILYRLILFIIFFSGNFVLVTEESIWQKGMVIYAIFFIFLSILLSVMNIVWSIVKDPKVEEERVHLLQNKNTIITNATVHDTKGVYKTFGKANTNENEKNNFII